MRYLAYLALAAPLVVSLILHVPSLPPFLGNWGFRIYAAYVVGVAAGYVTNYVLSEVAVFKST